MDDHRFLPHLTANLIRELDEDYPPSCIGLHESEAHAHRRAGERQIIDTLIARLADDLAVTATVEDDLHGRISTRKDRTHG